MTPLFIWGLLCLTLPSAFSVHPLQKLKNEIRPSSTFPDESNTTQLSFLEVLKTPTPLRVDGFYDLFTEVNKVISACNPTKHVKVLYQCLHDQSVAGTLPAPLGALKTKLVNLKADQGYPQVTAQNKKTIFVEGLGPVGGYLAVVARLMGHAVIIAEPSARFKERQSFSINEKITELFTQLELSASWAGVPKDVLQLLYLVLLSLFVTDVTFVPAEVTGVGSDGTKDTVVCINWDTHDDRDAQRTWLKQPANALYHPSYSVLSKALQTQDWSTTITQSLTAAFARASLVKYQPDVIFAAGGAKSTFHSFDETVYAAWQKSAGVVSEAVIVKFPIQSLNWIERETEDQLQVIYANVDKYSGDINTQRSQANYQAKFVPFGIYIPTYRNELWFELAWQRPTLTGIWQAIRPVLIPTEDYTLQNLDAHKHVQQLDQDISITLPYKLSWLISGATGLASLKNDALKTFLETYLFDDANMQTLPDKYKILADFTNGHITSFLISNRMIAKKSSVASKLGNSKLIFIGDAFHESIFLGGSGLQTHFEELFSTPHLINWLTTFKDADLSKFVDSAWDIGGAYVDKWTGNLKQAI